MEIKEQYLTTEDLAKEFNRTPQYIRSLLKQKVIPGELIGKTWLIDRSILTDQKILFKLKEDVSDQIRIGENKKGNPIALSFFSGAMGLDIGLQKAGIEVLLASEIDPSTRKTILINNPNIGLIGDINKYTANDIRRFAGLNLDQEIDLMIGGPPCQAFSTAGKRQGFCDTRGNVFLTFIDRILELQPKIAVIENVRGLLSAPLKHRPHTNRGFGYPPLTPEEEKGGALYHIIKKLEEGGYSVSYNLYNAANYGAPQKRERIVIFCAKNGQKIPYLNPTHQESGDQGLPKWRTVKEVIGDIEEEKQESLTFPEKRLKYYRLLKSGEYWKHLPEALQKEALGNSYYAGGGKTGFLRRLDWEKPSPTLVTDPTMPATDLAHPERNRPLSIQEYKRIQEFPDSWQLFGSLKEKYKQVGNAVPISLGKAIGLQVQRILNNEELPTPPVNFQFSRYKNTDDVSFRKVMRKRSKFISSKQPELIPRE